jgi:hypothetical protein
LRRLDREVVVHAILRVQPEGRGDLEARAQGDQQAVGDVALGEAELIRLGAIHGQLQLGLVEKLVHVRVHRAGNLANLSATRCATARFPATSMPTNCTSMGAERPKFNIWLTMSAGWKKNSTPGYSRGSSSRSFATYCAVGP